MFKSFLTALVVLVCAATVSNAAVTGTWEYSVVTEPASAAQQGYEGGGYNIVTFLSDDVAMQSVLTCIGGGSEECTMDNALSSLLSIRLFDGGDVNSLLQHAETNVASGNYSGTVVDDVLKDGFTYHRNLIWTSNSSTGDRDFTVIITEETP